MTEYVTVSIPKTLIEKIEAVKETYGYTSRPDFIKQAIRREFERLERKKVKQ